MQEPLVTVICLCHNQAAYVQDALESVVTQTYKAIELIVVDDASTDGSQDRIRQFMTQHPVAAYLALPQNQGGTLAFNQGLARAKGQFLIDLAADDVLLPERVAKQVEAFQHLPADYAVIFSDAWLIDEASQRLGTFYPRDRHGKLTMRVPSGNMYRELLRKQIVSSPTMMIRTSVLREMGGYDPLLSYEDYDFWVRTGRQYRYHFLEEPLTEKRVAPNSSRSGFYKKGHNPHLRSTLLVCLKAKRLNRTELENKALAVSIRYHLRLAFLTENFWIAERFALLLACTVPLRLTDWGWKVLIALRWRVNGIYRVYFRLRYRRG